MGTKKLSDIAVRIKAQRLKLGYSYNDLAVLTGMSKSSLQRYETGGIASFPLDKLDLLSMALQTTPDYLLGWEDNYVADGDIDGESKLLNSKLAKIDNKDFKSAFYALFKEINLLIDAYSHIENNFCINCHNSKESIKSFAATLLKQSELLHQNETNAIVQISKICAIMLELCNEKIEAASIDSISPSQRQ